MCCHQTVGRLCTAYREEGLEGHIACTNRRTAEKANLHGDKSIQGADREHQREPEKPPSIHREYPQQSHLLQELAKVCNYLYYDMSSPYHCRELLATCQTLAERTEAFFPGSRYKVLSGFLFLRFICPAIVSPNSFGIVDRTCPLLPYFLLTSSQQKTDNLSEAMVLRGLVLATKLIQGLANQSTFEKEPYMAPFNEFISANVAKIESFFTYLLVSSLVNHSGLIF